MEKIVKHIPEGNPQWSVAKDVSCSLAVVPKIWCKYKRNGGVEKGRHIDWLWKILKW